MAGSIPATFHLVKFCTSSCFVPLSHEMWPVRLALCPRDSLDHTTLYNYQVNRRGRGVYLLRFPSANLGSI